MRSRRTRNAAFLLVLGVASSLLAGGAARATGCADAAHPGGSWPALNHDLSNTRNQDQERLISSTTVPTLSARWTFSPFDQGGTGRLESTPVIAEGCLYITTASGFVYALNADTGALVWKGRFAESVSGVCCGGTLFAPSVNNGVLYLNVSRNPATSSDETGPHALAIDAHTGELIWKSLPVANEPGAYTNSSAVYFDGMIWIGISNPEMGRHHIGGFAILDAATGVIMKRTKTIPDDQFAAGFSGGSVWSTAAVDPVTKYAYAGSGQPSDWSGKESERVNAILKFDFDRNSATFGEIVDTLKGTPDDPPYIDVDFAGSPTLYRDANGQQMVAEFQKSGWLHAGHTRHMSQAWSRQLSPLGIPIGNYSSTATDGTNVFAVGTYPGQIFSLNGTTGLPNWAGAVITGIGGNPVTYANGVVYHADGKGFLDAWDSATGAPLAHRPMSVDTGGVCTNIGGGVSIARNTVYAVCGDRNGSFGIGPSNGPSGWVIAYRIG